MPPARLKGDDDLDRPSVLEFEAPVTTCVDLVPFQPESLRFQTFSCHKKCLLSWPKDLRLCHTRTYQVTQDLDYQVTQDLDSRVRTWPYRVFSVNDCHP